MMDGDRVHFGTSQSIERRHSQIRTFKMIIKGIKFTVKFPVDTGCWS
jgi:hypothetical protein